METIKKTSDYSSRGSTKLKRLEEKRIATDMAMDWLAKNIFVDANFEERDSEIFRLGKANTITIPVKNNILERVRDNKNVGWVYNLVINGENYIELNEQNSIHHITSVLEDFFKYLYTREELDYDYATKNGYDDFYMKRAIIKIVKDLVFSMGTHNHSGNEIAMMTENQRWGHQFSKKW